MVTQKTNKERAFLQDLFVSTDWSERFSSLIDENLKLPKEGDAVYLGSGTGGHALAIADRAGQKLRLLGIDENEESVNLAKAKATAANESMQFRRDNLEQLSLPNQSFDVVIGDGSLVALSRLPRVVPELMRIAKPGATVAFVLPTAPSFGEFFSLYWEALHNLGLLDREGAVEDLIRQVPTTWEMEDASGEAGLEELETFTVSEEFTYESGEAFLTAPLIADFLMREWLTAVPDEWKDRVASELVRLIDEERHEADFVLTVKATLIKGRKTRSH